MNDENHNLRVIFEDNDEVLIYANRLSNENLANWKGWHCNAGTTGIHIYKDDIYGGECRNDYLGSFVTDWQIFDQPTICKLDECKGCTSDLLYTKTKP